jgi:hypothetical protein
MWMFVRETFCGDDCCVLEGEGGALARARCVVLHAGLFSEI